MGTTTLLPVLLVASDPAVAADLVRMLRAVGFEAIGCASPEAARVQARGRRAEIALIDLPGQMPTALSLVEELRGEGVASILLGAADVQRLGASDRRTGPDAVLIRPFTSSHLACVINVVLQLGRIDAVLTTASRTPLDPAIEQHIRALADVRRPTSVMCGAGGGAHCVYPGLDLLSPREAEIARWLLQGQRVPAISRRLSISPHTVRNHIKAMFRKFGVHSQAELVDRLMGQTMPVPPLAAMPAAV